MTSPLHGEDPRFESGQAHCYLALAAQRHLVRSFIFHKVFRFLDAPFESQERIFTADLRGGGLPEAQLCCPAR